MAIGQALAEQKALDAQLSQVANQTGTAVVSIARGELVSSTGQLEDRTEIVDIIYQMLQDIRGIIPPGEKFVKLEIQFQTFTYAIVMHDKQIFIAKKENG